ncbi:hypothetical protein WMY93_000997 [Mugilogobius chulae]|uniref:Uncharacterized protein n=1 Tax=Mugilogobius chulae TaxID=88201 RepID=A0AAW0Q6Q9_9GOBI
MYSPVSKYSPDSRKKMVYRSTKSKSCGYYMRIALFFSSLIQSLIIVSLVLFLIYGNQEDTASVSKVQDLEKRYNQLSVETLSLRQQRKNLTNLLNITIQGKTRCEWDLVQLKATINTSYYFLGEMERKLAQCNLERLRGRINCPTDVRPQPFTFGCNCARDIETCKAKLDTVQINFTQTAMKMQMEIDHTARERDYITLEAIKLRRDKFVLEKAVELYQIKCKDEFINSMSGITNVSKAFLTKIDVLFPAHHPFQLTCPNQKDYLEQIRNNCTNLSEEVVRKFQFYLDTLGNKVSMSTGNISVLTAENIRMTRDYNLCSQNRTEIQLKNDEERETLINDKIKLKGEIEVLESTVRYKNTELDHLKQQLMHLNMTCIPRTGTIFPRTNSQTSSTWGLNPGSSSSGSTNTGSSNQFNRFGSSSSSFSSHGSSSSMSDPGLGLSSFNKQPSTGLGSSSLGSGSSLASSGLNKLGSSNQGSSTSFGSSSSSGTGLNKQTSSLSSFGNPSSSNSNQNTFGASGATGASSGSNSNSNFGSSSSKYGSSSSNFGSSNSNFGSSNSNFGSSSSNFGSSSSKLGSSNSNLDSSNSNQGSLGSRFGSSNSNSGSSNFGSSSSSNLGSSLGSSSNSNFGSSSLSKTTSNSRGSSIFGSPSSSSSNLGSLAVREVVEVVAAVVVAAAAAAAVAIVTQIKVNSEATKAEDRRAVGLALDRLVLEGATRSHPPDVRTRDRDQNFPECWDSPPDTVKTSKHLTPRHLLLTTATSPGFQRTIVEERSLKVFHIQK